jgi:hypothetical protein
MNWLPSRFLLTRWTAMRSPSSAAVATRRSTARSVASPFKQLRPCLPITCKKGEERFGGIRK